MPLRAAPTGEKRTRMRVMLTRACGERSTEQTATVRSRLSREPTRDEAGFAPP